MRKFGTETQKHFQFILGRNLEGGECRKVTLTRMAIS